MNKLRHFKPTYSKSENSWKRLPLLGANTRIKQHTFSVRILYFVTYVLVETQ